MSGAAEARGAPKEAGDTLLARAGGSLSFGRALAACCVHAVRSRRVLTFGTPLAHVLLAVLLGALYYQGGNDSGTSGTGFGTNGTRAVYCLLLLNHLLAVTPALFTMCGARSAAVRHQLNCSPATYYAATSVRDLLAQVVVSLVGAGLVYGMLGAPADSRRVLMFLGVVVFTALVAQAAGQLAGLVAPYPEAAVLAAVVLTVPLLLFSRYFLSPDSAPPALAWLAYLDYLNYGFEGALLALFGYGRGPLPCIQVYCPYKSPEVLLRAMSAENGSIWLDFGALIGFFVALRVASCAVLVLKSRRSQ